MKTVQLSMDEAVGFIKDGDEIVMVGGDPQPMALLRELIRRGYKDLNPVGIVGGGLNIDLLVGAGVVDSVQTCSMGLGGFAREAPNFVRHLKDARFYAKDST